MIKNNKGFAVTEVLILSTVILGVLMFMYTQFKNINRNYQYSFRYDTPGGMYLANNIIEYINNSNYDILIQELNKYEKGYIDITNCDVSLFSTSNYCIQLLQQSEIEKIIFTEEDLIKLKQNMNSFDNDLKTYIKQIKTTKAKRDYRIIIKYNDGTFASMRFNKGNSYVEEGLIAYLDGINNTGNGHSNETPIWKDLSNNGNDATLYNNPIWSNNSLTFDGISNYARLENTANIEFQNGTTWEVRVKVISNIGTHSSGTIEMLGNWQVAGGGIFISNTDDICFSFNITRSSDNQTVSQKVPYAKKYEPQKEYTITAIYDNTILKLYVDGEKISEKSLSGTFLPSQAPIALGGNPKVASNKMDTYANIEIKKLLIYNRALTEEEVKRNYQADMARY